MHELNLAQNIVDSVLSEAKTKGAKRVLELDVEVGELMQVDTKALRFGLKLLLTGPLFEGVRVRVRLKGATFSCRRCKEEWDMVEAKKQLERVASDLLVREPESMELPLHFFPYLYPAFIHCPKCGSSDTSVMEGKEIELRRLIMEP